MSNIDKLWRFCETENGINNYHALKYQGPTTDDASCFLVWLILITYNGKWIRNWDESPFLLEYLNENFNKIQCHIRRTNWWTICWFWRVKLQLLCAEVIFALFCWFLRKSNEIYCWKLAGCNYVSARWVLVISNFARFRDFLMHQTWTQGYDVYIDMPSLFVF